MMRRGGARGAQVTRERWLAMIGLAVAAGRPPCRADTVLVRKAALVLSNLDADGPTRPVGVIRHGNGFGRCFEGPARVEWSDNSAP